MPYYKSIFFSDVDKNLYKITNDDKDNLYIGAHQHTWNYTAVGDKLTATCSASTADCTLYQNNGYFVTIKASNQTYDGKEKKATIEAAKGWKGPDVNTIPITYQVQQGNTFVPMAKGKYPTAVGTYRASISLTGVDHKTATASVDYTIRKAQLTADDFTFTPPSDQLVYDGNAKAATVTPKKVAAGQITVKYYTENGSELKGLPTNAGIYTVKIDVEGTESYQAAKDLTANNWKFAIAKAKQTISVPQDKTLVKNGADVDISRWVSVSGVEGGSPAGKLIYALDGTYPGVTLTGSTLTAEKNATADTVTIKVTAEATQNYERAEATFTVTVSAKSEATLTKCNMTGWTYGGEPNQPSYETVSDVIENTRKTTYATKNSDGTNSTFTEEVPTAVGNYTVKVTFETASSVYTGTADFIISPKSLTTGMVTSIASQTYTGKKLSTTATLADNKTPLVDGTDYAIVSYKDNVNAGTNTATAIIEGRGNYTGTINVPWTIDRCILQGGVVYKEGTLTKVYDGTTSSNLAIDCFKDTNRTEHHLVAGKDYQFIEAPHYERPEVSAESDYNSISYRIKLTSNNYTFSSGYKFLSGWDYGIITQAQQTISVPQDKTLVKNGAGVDISQWVSVSGVEGGSPAARCATR